MSAETDAVIDYDSLTANGRTELHFRQLCRRLLDIDGECGIVKGCSANLAAWPMIHSWREAQHGDLPETVAQTLQRMLAANGQGRSCEFEEIKYYAEKFLQLS